MTAALAVVWCNGTTGAPTIGRLEMLPDRLHLEGSRGGKWVTEDVPLTEIARTHIARYARQRIGGRQTLVLDRVGAQGALLIASVFGVGALTELLELLGG
jgi:hypothetical protein